jgi:hypothetical protein
MDYQNDSNNSDPIIGTIENKENPEQKVDILYLRHENAFVTSGIRRHLSMKEILVPVHLIAKDFQLIGAIISAIMERMTQARESHVDFRYAPRFEVLGKIYTLTEYGDYMKLESE